MCFSISPILGEGERGHVPPKAPVIINGSFGDKLLNGVIQCQLSPFTKPGFFPSNSEWLKTTLIFL